MEGTNCLHQERGCDAALIFGIGIVRMYCTKYKVQSRDSKYDLNSAYLLQAGFSFLATEKTT